MNNELTFIERIKDTKIEVTITNEKGVETKKTFKNFELNYLEDYAFKFMLPYKTKSLELSFTGKLQKQDGKPQNLKVNKDITIDTFISDDFRLFSYYLTYQKDKGYVLKALGRNGEGFPNEEFDLRLYNKRSLHNSTYSGAFDDEGCFYLGK